MLVFEKRYLDRMSTKSTEFLHHMTPHACTQDPRFFSHKLFSKCVEIKPQLMMAAATGLPSVGYKTWCACHQSVCIVCSTIRDKTANTAKKITDYRPSVPGPTCLEHWFFFCNYLHNMFYAVANTIQMIYSTFS